MSRPTDRQVPFPQGESGSEITHFDATLRRKERMRQRAEAHRSVAATIEIPNGDEAMVANPTALDGHQSKSAPELPPLLRSTNVPVVPESTGAAPPPEKLESFLINFVVEQTGYPPEIVELDADLEADLGIDSIKKAQMFGELREFFDMTPPQNLTLDDFPTLRHVLNFLRNAQPKEAKSTLDALRTLMIDHKITHATDLALTGETRLIEDLGLDSRGMLELITAVEEKFGIAINLDELEIDRLNSAGAFAALIQRKLDEKEKASGYPQPNL